MGGGTAIRERTTAVSAPPPWLGAAVAAVAVLGLLVVHDLWISDIWFNAGPMLASGALCGLALTWSYRTSVAEHSTGAWFGYAGIYVAEMLLLGAVSLTVLRPRWTMGELMVADDAFDRLLPPSVPLMIGAIVLGTLVIWALYGRRMRSLGPVALTQVLLVFLLGHQFAFLGLVESEIALFVVFAEFALITAGLAAVFCLGVMGAVVAVRRA